MIDFGDYEHARAMTKITSDYLSYIFRNTTDRVPVLAESKHCEDYLKILLLRYPDKFTYYIEVHDEVADAEIFPFLIQVYVENAAKQALMADEKMLISVTVYPEDRDDEKYVNILSRIRERDFRTKYYVNYKMDKTFLTMENISVFGTV